MHIFKVRRALVRRLARRMQRETEEDEARDATGAEWLWRRHLSGANDYLLRAGATTLLDMFA